MHIVVIRTGGLAGIERGAEVETSGRADAADVEAIARRAMAPGRDAPAPGVPDGFRYEITMDGRTVHLADPRLTGDQRELIKLVLKA